MILHANFSLHIITLSLLITNFVTYGMNESQQITELTKRPTIHVNLFIDHHAKSVTYAGSNYYTEMNEAGIFASINNQQAMPLINVIVTDEKGTNWVYNPLMIVQEYETKKMTTISADDCRAIMSKKFPHALPADFLYQLKTGNTLNLTIHKYPVIATCSDNPDTQQSFEQDFTQHMANFITKPTYFSDICSGVNVEEELKNAGLIKIKHNRIGQTILKHGKNGFVSIEQVLLKDKQIPCMIKYLHNREIEQKHPSIISQSSNELEMYSSQEDSGSETDEERTVQCTIS